MSRSNPQDHLTNPAVRWFEWNGDGTEGGNVRYYDKDARKELTVDLPFTFLLLDQVSTVKGWHNSSDSAIYANQIKDVSQDVLVVKAFNGGVLAEGRYKTIKPSVNAAGGYFVGLCYIAFKSEAKLEIGTLAFKGSALHAWTEFQRANHQAVYNTHAVTIDGFNEGRKGSIRFRTPTFRLTAVGEEMNQAAKGMDVELQTFLTAYFKKTKATPAEHTAAHDEPALVPAPVGGGPADVSEDAIPF